MLGNRRGCGEGRGFPPGVCVGGGAKLVCVCVCVCKMGRLIGPSITTVIIERCRCGGLGLRARRPP